MDIHKPKPWHGLREFLKEYVIVVVGVLTALALEQAVEAFHNRSNIAEAEAAMRLELSTDDGPQGFARLAIAPCLALKLAALRTALDQPAPDQTFADIAKSYDTPMRTYDMEAWKALVAEGVGAHIGAERLYAWSGPYRIMPILNEDTQKEGEFSAELRALGSGPASSSTRERARNVVAQLDRLNTFIATVSTIMLQRSSKLGAGLSAADEKALMVALQRRHGSCVKAFNVQLRPELSGPSVQQEIDIQQKGLVSP